MDIHKLAAWAQILSLPFGAYCAYGAYVVLHPGAALPISFNSTVLAIAFGAFGSCLLIVAFEKAATAWKQAKASPRPFMWDVINQENANREIKQLREQLATDMSAKSDREGRLQECSRELEKQRARADDSFGKYNDEVREKQMHSRVNGKQSLSEMQRWLFVYPTQKNKTKLKSLFPVLTKHSPARNRLGKHRSPTQYAER
jgi:hypothetical protein